MPSNSQRRASRRPSLFSFPGDHKEAERVGFEPTRRLNTAYAISSRAPSANSDTSPFIRSLPNAVRGRYIAGKSLYSGASSDGPDQEECPDCADTQNRPAPEAVVRLYVLFFVLVVEVVEDSGPEEKVREGAVPAAVVGAVVGGALGVGHPLR